MTGRCTTRNHVVFKSRGLSLFELQQAQIFSHSKFYSFMEIIRRAMLFAWVDLAIAIYAHKLNQLWQKKNKAYLKVLDLFRLKKKEVKIVIDYQEQVRLEDEVTGAVV